MIDNNQLIEQLAAAMDKHPGRCVLDIIKDACEYKYPTRTDKHYDIIESSVIDRWILTNDDILRALTLYNRKS